MKGRFAPSPSGRMHLGNVFCALMAWLSCRAQNGTMLLRVEDLDPARCRPEYTEQLIRDLTWLGLDWDEGGDLPAYRQSERAAWYAECFARLEAMGRTYPCFCSRSELHDASAPHASDGTVIYRGNCRALSDAERAAKAAARAPAQRLWVNGDPITFTDHVYGQVKSNLAEDCGDFILRRSDGVYAYQLAVVADDAAMGVTEVVRGHDLLSSTPRQLLLYRLLGFTAPQFAHLPLLVAPDGKRLSKRERALDVGALQASGITAEQIIGMLAWLAGLTETAEPCTAKELVPIFDLRKITKQDIVVSENLFLA